MQFATTIARAFGVIATTVCSLGGVAADKTPLYSLVERLPEPSANWDYAIVDAASRRLYLAQRGVTALDLKTNKATAGLVAGEMTHGLAILGDGVVAVDDSKNKMITVFNGESGKVLALISTVPQNSVNGNHALDALVFEPKSRLLVAINGESGLLLLVDVKPAAVIGTVSVGGHPEFAVVDNAGTLYVNVDRDKNADIVAVDVVARKVIRHAPLRGCEGPTGLAFDQADNLLISVCENGVAKFIDADSNREVASIPVGKGADAVMYDPQRRFAFVPGATEGTLSIIAVRGAADIALVQTLATQSSTRLGAVDIASGKIYLPAARFAAPIAPIPYPSVIPGSFVAAPN